MKQQINNLKNNILYRSHLYLYLKNKLVLTIFLQISLVFLLTNLNGGYTYCMTNENENISIISSTSSVSSVFDYDDDYIEHCVEPLVEHATDTFIQQFNETYFAENLSLTERSLGPIFEYLKTDNSVYLNGIEDFDTRTLPEKINKLQYAYFSESVERSVLHDALEKQTEQLFRRQNSLIEAKSQIKSLTHENLELKNQIDELQRILAETLRK